MDTTMERAERAASLTASVAGHTRALANAAERLSAEFDGVMSRQEVADVIEAEYARIAQHARVTDFLPIFAERAARERCLAFAAAAHDRELVSGART